jgi:hypothetical protein
MFEKYAVIDPIVHKFEKEPDWTWTIKPPTGKEEVALARFLATGRVVFEGDKRIVYPWSPLEIAYREIALLFGGTTVPKSAEDSAPVLTEKSSVSEIERFLQSIPVDAVMEIWKAIGDAVPFWGPAKPQENGPKE